MCESKVIPPVAGIKKANEAQGSLLSPQRAFVVQFHADTDLEGDRCTGRVEHVVSGQATHFQSLDDLLVFITRILHTIPAPSSSSRKQS
jgi:hypothetical protein